MAQGPTPTNAIAGVLRGQTWTLATLEASCQDQVLLVDLGSREAPFPGPLRPPPPRVPLRWRENITTQLSMRSQVQSLASLCGLRIQLCREL